ASWRPETRGRSRRWRAAPRSRRSRSPGRAGVRSPRAMDEVIPGILHWKAKHPNIGVEVSSYLLTDSGTALDPLLADGQSVDGFERAVLTVRHHIRSTPGLGVPVFVHRSGLHEFEGTDVDVRGYEAGDELVPGVRVLPFGRI